MTQLNQVRDHLITHGEITSWDAIMSYGITRVGEYIRQLRVMWGHDAIETVYETNNGKTYGRYIYKRELTLF